MLSTPIAPGTKMPGFYIRLNLLAATLGAGAGALWALIAVPKNTADGDITPNTEIRQVFSADEAATSHGVGGQGHLMAKAFFRKNPNGVLFMAAPTASAGVA